LEEKHGLVSTGSVNVLLLVVAISAVIPEVVAAGAAGAAGAIIIVGIFVVLTRPLATVSGRPALSPMRFATNTKGRRAALKTGLAVALP
jgi:hypothetical protein